MRDFGLIVVGALLLRVPFAETYLWAWDSVLYARAIELGFNLGELPDLQRPHPPGYIFYVLLARAATALTGDANAGLVMVSAIAGALACGVAYLFARDLAGRTAGLMAGAVMMANPVLWHASAIAYPYSLLGLLSGLFGLLLWRARDARPHALVLASALFGVAIGARQDLAAVLGPLWLFALWRRGHLVTVLGALAVLLAGLSWLLPSALAAGGLERYLGLVLGQALGSSGALEPGGTSISSNVSLTAVGLRWQLLWLWPLAAAGAWRIVRERSRSAAGIHFAIWLVAPVAFYSLFHIGESGYTLSVAVPLAVLTGLGIDGLARAAPRRFLPVALGVPGALILVLAASFVVGDGRFSAAAIRRHDVVLREQIAFIREHFAARETIIFSRANYWHGRYYLSEYPSLLLPEGEKRGRLERRLSAHYAHAVFFDDSWLRFKRNHASRLQLAQDVDLYYLPLGRRAVVITQDRADLLQAGDLLIQPVE